ncbi:MAG: M28 family peptidase, partial [Thermoanaerobaculia bacterium]
MPSRRATLIPAIALAAILIAAIQSTHGLNVRPASAPAREFSAVRALATLRTVLGGNVPHPIGTAANDAVRERIGAHLAGLGYLVQVQRTFACDGYGTCGNVANIIARRPGDPARPGIMLAAHYDSVPAGPGASDDGIGVATLLEIARAIRQEPFKNPPVFLIDDGEEAGLLGAEGFAHDRDLLRSTAMVINVEARGTTGPSLLFETSRMNRWLVDHAVSRQRRPVTSSLFATIYDLLPNDTDLTVFKRAGVQGVNFGVIGNLSAYHTPLDTLENLDPRSLQHHGDNALDVLRGVGNVEMGTSDENAVWFDVLTRFVVHWPERATIWITIASCIALIIASLLLVREDRSRISDIALGAVAFVASIALSAAAGFAIATLGRLRASGATWVAHPEPLIVAMWIAAVVVTLVVFAAIRRRAGAEGMQLG